MKKNHNQKSFIRAGKRGCNHCTRELPLDRFSVNRNLKDGYNNICKDCAQEKRRAYHRSPAGIVSATYSKQKIKSARRGHKMPDYTREELLQWMYDNGLEELMETWKDNGYPPELVPSVDRLDIDKGYTFDNIQLVTWGENQFNYYRDAREGKGKGFLNQLKPVVQLTLEGVPINEFTSMSSASRELGISQPSISKCCRESHRQTGGYKWKYKNEKNE